MIISNITYQYDADQNVNGYIIFVEGTKGDIKTFSGQLTLDVGELDLSFAASKVQEKIAEIFSAQEEE